MLHGRGNRIDNSCCVLAGSTFAAQMSLLGGVRRLFALAAKDWKGWRVGPCIDMAAQANAAGKKTRQPFCKLHDISAVAESSLNQHITRV